jgi:hypothetical protein
MGAGGAGGYACSTVSHTGQTVRFAPEATVLEPQEPQTPYMANLPPRFWLQR